MSGGGGEGGDIEQLEPLSKLIEGVRGNFSPKDIPLSPVGGVSERAHALVEVAL